MDGMQVDLLVFAVVFTVGTAVGSFLNVVIDRLPLKKSIIKGRSHCDHCRRTLRWFELIPLLSFVFLRGRCRTCGQKLSWQYPAVEMLTGVVFLLIFNFQFSIFNFILAVLMSALIVVSVVDLKLGIIPDEVLVFLLVVWGLKEVGGIRSIEGIGQEIALAAVPAVAAGLFFYLLVLVTRGRGMGGGDVKLAFIIGLFLSPGQTFIAIYAAFILGGLVALALLAVGRKKFGQTVPFGPFLAVGTLVGLLWGDELIRLYLTGMSLF